MGQLFLGDTGHPLEVVMTGVAEVRGAEAEENSHRAAVPALILQEVRAVFGAHLNQHIIQQALKWELFQFNPGEVENNFLLGF